ncbi:MAG: hypothetical protein ACP5I4_07565 [Oceanipulchritudo sp.]
MNSLLRLAILCATFTCSFVDGSPLIIERFDGYAGGAIGNNGTWQLTYDNTAPATATVKTFFRYLNGYASTNPFWISENHLEWSPGFDAGMEFPARGPGTRTYFSFNFEWISQGGAAYPTIRFLSSGGSTPSLGFQFDQDVAGDGTLDFKVISNTSTDSVSNAIAALTDYFIYGYFEMSSDGRELSISATLSSDVYHLLPAEEPATWDISTSFLYGVARTPVDFLVLDTAGSSNRFTIDEIRLGTQYADVVLAGADVPVAGYGESAAYTATTSRSLRLVDGTAAVESDIDRPFSATAPMEPDPGLDPGTPEFFGGWGYADGTGESFDFPPQVNNDSPFGGGFDAVYFPLNSVAGVAENFGYLMMFDATALEYQYLNSFVFAATRSIGQGQAVARSVVRVGGNYYIGSNETIFSNVYQDLSLDFVNLESYDPASAIVPGTGTPAVLNDTDLVDAVGVYFERRWPDTVETGNAWIGIGKILVTSKMGEAKPIPVPSVYMFEDSGSLVIASSTLPAASLVNYQLQKSGNDLSGFTDVVGEVQPADDSGQVFFVQPLPAAGEKVFYQVEAKP